MDEKKNAFDYLAQILIIFGSTILVMNIFCLAFGNTAKDFSSMFALGNQGLSVAVTFQFLCVSICITGTRIVFFTDMWIKKMPIWLRTLCMLVSVVLIMTAFIAAFQWFPIGMWQPWAMFFLCFGISFLVNCLVMALKEKAENKQMEEALRLLKEEEEKHA